MTGPGSAKEEPDNPHPEIADVRILRIEDLNEEILAEIVATSMRLRQRSLDTPMDDLPAVAE